MVRVYADSTYPKSYKIFLLNQKMIDANSDGYKDLVIYGTEFRMADENIGKIVGERFLLFIFLFEPDTTEFQLAYATVSVDEYDDYFPFCMINDNKISKKETDALPSVQVQELKEEFKVDFNN